MTPAFERLMLDGVDVKNPDSVSRSFASISATGLCVTLSTKPQSRPKLRPLIFSSPRTVSNACGDRASQVHPVTPTPYPLGLCKPFLRRRVALTSPLSRLSYP